MVAIEPIFDISGIDLSQVAVPADKVGEMNPQCGDMRQVDYVIWTADDFTKLVGVKQVRDDEFWVPGHIPGRPLLPGVLMIEAAAQLASISFKLRAGVDGFLAFTRIGDAVFRAQVVPGDRLLLLVHVTKYSPRRFVCKTQGIVDDAIAFEATIAGLVVKDDQGRGGTNR